MGRRESVEDCMECARIDNSDLTEEGGEIFEMITGGNGDVDTDVLKLLVIVARENSLMPVLETQRGAFIGLGGPGAALGVVSRWSNGEGADVTPRVASCLRCVKEVVIENKRKEREEAKKKKFS